MRILFHDFKIPYLLKNTEFPIGGFTIRLKQIIDELVLYNNKVAVATWEGANKFIDNAFDFSLIETYNPDKGLKKISLFYYKLPKLYSALKKFKPDIIIQGSASINTGFYALFSKIFKIPFIYMAANDIDADERYKSRLKLREQIAFRYGLKHCSAIVCQNTYQYEQFKKKFPEKHLEIIKNPYKFCEANVLSSGNNKRSYIAWIGVFQKQKNLKTLFNLAHLNQKYEFRIAGIEGKMDQETKEALYNLKKLNNVTFVGYLKRDDIAHFLSESMALLNTSQYEGISNTFLEALSLGTPILSVKSNPNNMITENNLGYMVNYENFSGIVQNLENNFDYQKAYKNFIKYLKNNHDPKKIALQFNKFCLASIEAKDK